MRFKIRHDLQLSYPSPARSVIMVLRLTPRSHEGQHIAAWRIDLDVDCLLAAGEDAFGNIVHTFNAEGPLQRIGVLVEGEVETFDAAGIVRGSVERFPPPLYLRETPLTVADAALRRFAERVAQSHDGALDILHGLMKEIHAALEFEAAGGGEARTAAQALAHERGEPRDLAHVFIACARHLAIPARYVSGFFVPSENGEAQDHGWAEAHVADIGWIGFDCVDDTCPQESHVRIACGLDFFGVAPVRAARAGGSGESPTILVRKAEEQASRQSRTQKQS